MVLSDTVDKNAFSAHGLFFVLRGSAFVLSFLVLSVLPAAAKPETSKLVPYRALYEMSLEEARPGSVVSAVLGYMMLEFYGSRCEGFTANMTLVNNITDLNGETTVVDFRFKSWEHGEGEELTFEYRQLNDRQLAEVTKGKAKRAGAKSSVSVEVVKPVAISANISGDVLFPTQFSELVVAAAERGESVVKAKVYDGAERGARASLAIAFIGDKISPREDDFPKDSVGGKNLKKINSWPVSVSYFDPSARGDVEPVRELSYQLYSNGVTRALVVDKGDHVVRGVLQAIELLPLKPCD